MKQTWCEVTMKYLQLISNNDKIILRKELCEYLPNMKEEIQFLGKSPDQTLSRTLQILRDMGYIDFLSRGVYKIIDLNFEYVPKISKGEQTISRILNELNFHFEREKKFDDLKHNSYLRLDFFFECNNKRFAIEFDGLQHHKPVEYFGGEKSFQNTKKRDKIKNDWCKNNNIKLLRCSKCDYKHLKFIIIKFILENKLTIT